ncbi:MAG: D-2-hydroxyacid dehydrogenase [Bacteroidales bacterium]|nr:D-2-hydroxyacid dehydrogenase [Bacteroidales bacterium]
MKKIVVLDGYAANPGDISWEPWKELGELTVYERTAPEETVERCKDAEIVLTNKVVFDAKVIEALPALKYIGVLATGYNVVDLEAASKHGIIVTNIPAYSTLSVAQMVFAHLLNITHHVAQHAERVTNGAWQNSKDFCFWDSELIELDGLTLGIVGLGNIGRAVARIAQTFGMKVMAYSSKSVETLAEMGIQKAASYEDIFRTADVVSLHCPLNAQTKHLVNAERLALMKPSAILINTGRGPLIDEQALADALNSGRIYAAGVDVLTQEPPRAGSPLIGARNCYITPHVAWATRAARERLDKIAFENVRAYLSGTPQNVVN